MSKFQKLVGRFKRTAGEAIDDPAMRREGKKQEREADLREEAALAEEEAEAKQREVADLERKTR
jgi:uncharacterized protein YjbJ (UPF0337 family)